MRSKPLLVAVCLAVIMAAAGVASADVFSGRIAPGKTKIYSLTTDISTILQIQAIAAHERTDLDIMVTIKEEADDIVVLDSASGMKQMEQGTVGVGGAVDVTITITNASGPKSRFMLVITEPGSPEAGKGARIDVAYAGEFGTDEYVSDPRLASLQRLVQKSVDRKR